MIMENKWQKIVNDILEHMSQVELAAEINGSQARISDIGSGKQKKITYEDGVIFMRLHKRLCKKAA